MKYSLFGQTPYLDECLREIIFSSSKLPHGSSLTTYEGGVVNAKLTTTESSEAVDTLESSK